MQASASSLPTEFEFYLGTDKGRSRSNNEDTVAMHEEAGLVVLADGMGGYNAGEVASRMASDFITLELGRWLLQARHHASDKDVRRAMDICVDNANRAIFEASQTHPQYAGMGTTLVIGVFRPGRVVVGHIGDSRGYRWRLDQLQQITHDHSLLQEQIDAGLLTPAQAKASTHKNLVTRAVGVEPFVALDTSVHDIERGDLFLLCSDGLSDMLPETALAQTLQAHDSLSALGCALVQGANNAGGKDNISVILTRVNGAPNVSRGQTATRWWPFKTRTGP
jgi:PPM family protein phosphatase